MPEGVEVGAAYILVRQQHLSAPGALIMTNTTHEAFADESYTDHRYRSVAVVTLEASRSAEVSSEIADILDRAQVAELKWTKLRQARDRFAALHVIDAILDRAIRSHLRVDVLVWDTEDSRHKIPERDDIANLQRMYYYLCRNVLSTRWPPQSTWALFPDENTAMDWISVQNRLDAAGASLRAPGDPSAPTLFRINFAREFRIQHIAEVDSKTTPLAQVADLFAGLGAFSYMAYPTYALWRLGASGQEDLPLSEVTSGRLVMPPGKSDLDRFQVMIHLDETCKANRLTVGLKSSQGFRTYDPRLPLNFWLYAPQSESDKAPTKGNS